jgi:hypothetical protein
MPRTLVCGTKAPYLFVTSGALKVRLLGDGLERLIRGSCV